MAKWARANRTEFYKLAARLIPTETHIAGDFALKSADDAELDAAIETLAAEAGINVVAQRKTRRRYTNQLADYTPTLNKARFMHWARPCANAY
ncbi:hypothetical protein [Xylella fastidiosa]|uniref:hypothetical protein n=1 Tax=Xylella fastidiosa TaxID=2371 RepID=UPI0034DF588A